MKVSVRADDATAVVTVSLPKGAARWTPTAWKSLAALLAGAVDAAAPSQCSFWLEDGDGNQIPIPEGRSGWSVIQTMDESDIVVVEAHPAADRQVAASLHHQPSPPAPAAASGHVADSNQSAWAQPLKGRRHCTTTALEAQLDIAANFAAEHSGNPEANEGAALVHQEMEYFSSESSSDYYASAFPDLTEIGGAEYITFKSDHSAGAVRDVAESGGSDTLLADDSADGLSAFGSETDGSGRSPSTVRSDYGEESGREDPDDDLGAFVETLDDSGPIDLPAGGLLRMVAEGTLPRGRFVVPDRVASIDRYTTMVQWQVAAELHEQILSERKRKSKVVLRLSPQKVKHGKGEITVKAPRPGKVSKSAWKKEVATLAGCLLELRPELVKSPPGSARRRTVSTPTMQETDDSTVQPKMRMVIYVQSVGNSRDYEQLQCEWVVGHDAEALPETPTLFTFINLGFVRPAINKFGAAGELSRRETQLGDLLACPRVPRCRTDADELEWEDVVDDAADVEDGSRSVPINRRQFSAIKRIGCDKVVLIQGPPGTGKSTTIFNAIKFRLPPLKQAIVVAVTNQAVSAVLEKFVQTKCYIRLEDCRVRRGPIRDAPDGRFSFALCCGAHKLDHLVPEARQFHIDAITNRLVDCREEVVQIALQFKMFEAAMESMTELEKRWRNLFFHKGGKDRSRSWRASFRKWILNRKLPEWQQFADLELSRPVGTGVPGEVKFEAGDCRSFDEFRQLCLGIWRDHLQRVRQKHFKELKRHILINSDVLLCTIDTMHNKPMRELWRDANDRLHSIYIDEASLVPEEAMPIIALFNPITLALIGDHEQLRPFSKMNYNLTNGEDKRFNRSFFERCVDCGLRYTMLRDNYRNPPDLVAVLNSMTYGGQLVAHRPRGSQPSIEWRDHTHHEAETTDGHPSSKNVGEVNEVRLLYNRLKKAGEKSILIITFYTGQYRALQQEIEVVEEDGDRICTVDSCQGIEAQTVIISCVRSNNAGRVGFTTHPNRLNVAISRAQRRLILVGNQATFLARSRRKRHKNLIWTEFIAAFSRHQ